MEQLFVALEKVRYPTKQTVRTVLASKHPDMGIKSIIDGGDKWVTRLAADEPSKLEDSMDDSDLPALPGEDDVPKDDASDAKDEDKEDKPKDDDKEKKPKKDKDGDLAGEVQKIIDQLTDLLGDLGGAAGELQGKHDEKADKLKDVADIVGDDAGAGPPGLEDTPEEIGPTPGGPDLGGAPPVPTGPHPPKGFDSRKKPGVGVPTFTNSKIVSVPIFKQDGAKVSVAAAVERITTDDRYTEYEVSGIQTDEDSDRYVAHLVLKD